VPRGIKDSFVVKDSSQGKDSPRPFAIAIYEPTCARAGIGRARAARMAVVRGSCDGPKILLFGTAVEEEEWW